MGGVQSLPRPHNQEVGLEGKMLSPVNSLSCQGFRGEFSPKEWFALQCLEYIPSPRAGPGRAKVTQSCHLTRLQILDLSGKDDNWREHYSTSRERGAKK